MVSLHWVSPKARSTVWLVQVLIVLEGHATCSVQYSGGEANGTSGEPGTQYSFYTQPHGEHSLLAMCMHCRAGQPDPALCTAVYFSL